MKTKLIASATALGAVACLGAVGIAGASSSSGGSTAGPRTALIAEVHQIATSGTLPSGFSCATADRALGRIAAAQQRVPNIEARLQAAAAAAAGTPRAAAIDARLATAQQVAADLPVVANVITSSCPGASTSSPTATKVAQRIESMQALIAEVHQIATSGTLPSNFSCAQAPAVQRRLATVEARLDGRVATLTSREQQATSAGTTARAAAISARITQLTGLRADLETVSGLVTAACPAN